MVGSVISPAGTTSADLLSAISSKNSVDLCCLSTFGKPAAFILQAGSWGHFQARQPTTEGEHYRFLYWGGV